MNEILKVGKSYIAANRKNEDGSYFPLLVLIEGKTLKIVDEPPFNVSFKIIACNATKRDLETAETTLNATRLK